MRFEPLEDRQLMTASPLSDFPPLVREVDSDALVGPLPPAPQAAPLAASAVTSPQPLPLLSYLNDTDYTAPPAVPPGAPPIENDLFPRLNMSLGAIENTEEASAYDIVAYNGSRIATAAQLKTKYPDTIVLRYYLDTGIQQSHSGDGSQMPFTSTGPVTNGKGQFFAGHWQYLAGTKSLAAITASQLTLPVQDPSRIKAGAYVVIYDGQPGSFNNAEHALVQSVDLVAGTITLAARGYLSNPTAHGAGAVIAQHAVVPGGTTAAATSDWAYNMSSACPVDASGNQINKVQADWVSLNLSRTAAGTTIGNFKFDGLRLDGDLGFFQTNPGFDPDNDLVANGGLDAAGNNLYGTGMEFFYARLRANLGPNAILVGGNGNVRGFASLNGDEGQGYPTATTGFDAPPDYTQFDQKYAFYQYHTHQSLVGPQYNEILNKNPTLLYPKLQVGGIPPTSNAPFRFSFGFSLLQDGSYGQFRGNGNAWWDEYSVDVVPGSPTYGKAIPNNPLDQSNVRAHEGWLGAALGPAQRLYNAANFAAAKSMVRNGTFDFGVGNWKAANVTISKETAPANVDVGRASMHISPQLQYNPTIPGATVSSTTFKLQANVQYTVSFAAKSSKQREVGVEFTNGTVTTTQQNFLISNFWQTHIATFSVATAGSYSLAFLLGRESSDVYLDEVYVFQGSVNVFQRDFEFGTVFVNATSTPQTINLSSVYQRILGTQDPINDGTIVSGSITIPAYDSATLIRQGASSTIPHAPGNLTAKAMSTTSIALHWEDLSGNEGSFAIARKTAGGTFVQIATVGGGVTSFTNTGLVPNTQYSYRVYAVNSLGKSVASNVVTIKSPLVNPPATTENSVATSSAFNSGVINSGAIAFAAAAPATAATTSTSLVSAIIPAAGANVASLPAQPPGAVPAGAIDVDPLRVQSQLANAQRPLAGRTIAARLASPISGGQIDAAKRRGPLDLD